MAEKTCFIAMPLTTSEEAAGLHHGDTDHFVHVLEHLFVPAVEAAGFKPIKPIMSGADVIQGQIIKYLETADLVLCDISGHNPNVFFELGIRTALDRPVALVRDDKTHKLPFDTSIVNTHTYGSALTPWTMDAELKALAKHIADTNRNTPSNNALWGFFGLTKRASERSPIENPLEAKVDLLMRQVAQLVPESGNDEWDEDDYLADKIFALAAKSGVVIAALTSSQRGVEVAFEDNVLPVQLVRGLEQLEKQSKRKIEVTARPKHWPSNL